MLNSLILIWVVNSADSDSESLNFKWKFCLKLIKNGEAKMIEKNVLLIENSVFKNYLTQSFCM